MEFEVADVAAVRHGIDGQRDCAERKGGHHQAHPKSREDAQEALPKVAAHTVSRRAPRDQVSADPEESVDGDGAQRGAVDSHVMESKPAQFGSVGIDNGKRKDETQKVQAVSLWVKSYADCPAPHDPKSSDISDFSPRLRTGHMFWRGADYAHARCGVLGSLPEAPSTRTSVSPTPNVSRISAKVRQTFNRCHDRSLRATRTRPGQPVLSPVYDDCKQVQTAVQGVPFHHLSGPEAQPLEGEGVTLNPVVICLPSALSTYQRPPSWSMP